MATGMESAFRGLATLFPQPVSRLRMDRISSLAQSTEVSILIEGQIAKLVCLGRLSELHADFVFAGKQSFQLYWQRRLDNGS